MHLINQLSIIYRLDQDSQEHFLDFIIDGTSLFDLLDMSGKSKIGLKNYTDLIDFPKKSFSVQFPFVNKYLLYVGTDNLDIRLSNTSFEIIETKETVTWLNFSNEESFHGIDYSSFNENLRFTFDKQEYYKIIKDQGRYYNISASA